MPSVATSNGEPDQKSQNFEIQRDHQANLEEGSAAFTLENRFPENQVKESMGFMVPPRARGPTHHCSTPHHAVAARLKPIRAPPRTDPRYRVRGSD
jgi:hypothetical protein